MTETSKTSTENCRDFKDFHEYSLFFVVLEVQVLLDFERPHTGFDRQLPIDEFLDLAEKKEKAGIQKSIGSKVLDSKLGLYKKRGGTIKNGRGV